MPLGATRQGVYTNQMIHARRVGPGLGQTVLRYWWLVAIVAIGFGALGFVWSSQQDQQYTATTRLFLSHSSAFDGFGQSSFVANPDRYAVNQATLATSRPVLERAVTDADLGVDTDELEQSLVITAGRGNDVIIIEATADTPEVAAEHANAVAASYQAFKLDEVERQTEQLTALSTSDEERAAVLKRAAVYGTGIELIEEAFPPAFPSAPQPRRDTLLALLVGAAVGTALAAGFDMLRRSREQRREAESMSADSEPTTWSRPEATSPVGATTRAADRRSEASTAGPDDVGTRSGPTPDLANSRRG